VLTLGTALSAADPETSEVASEPAVEAAQASPAERRRRSADEKKICRTEKATGSLTRRNRICLTAAQWRDVTTARAGCRRAPDGASGAPDCVSGADCRGTAVPARRILRRFLGSVRALRARIVLFVSLPRSYSGAARQAKVCQLSGQWDRMIMKIGIFAAAAALPRPA
jgi:hypothetical protein